MLEAPPHGSAVFYARQALDHFFLRTKARTDVFIASNLLVIHRDGEAETRLGPDLLVAFGLEAEPESSYKIAEQRKPPDWVLEVVSPSSRSRDRTLKKRQYAAMGVGEYWILDPGGGQSEPQLQGFRLEQGRYVRLSQGQGTPVAIRSEVLGLDLWLDGAMLRLRASGDGSSVFVGQEGKAVQLESEQEREANTRVRQGARIRQHETETARQAEANARSEAEVYRRETENRRSGAEATRQEEARERNETEVARQGAVRKEDEAQVARQEEARERNETEVARQKAVRKEHEAQVARQEEARERSETEVAWREEARERSEAEVARQREARERHEAESRIAELEARVRELERSRNRHKAHRET